MATNLPSCFSIEFSEQFLKFLVNFTLLKYVKSQRRYGFLITKELIFGFQILDLKDHFSASLMFRLKLLIINKSKGTHSKISVIAHFTLSSFTLDLISCFWPIFVDFQNEAASLCVNNSINSEVTKSQCKRRRQRRLQIY